MAKWDERASKAARGRRLLFSDGIKWPSCKGTQSVQLAGKLEREGLGCAQKNWDFPRNKREENL